MALLAGCAEMPGLSDYAMAPANAPVNDDPSYHVSQLKGGMVKRELDAIYGKRLVRKDGDAGYDLYAVESASARPGAGGERERLALWMINGHLATWGIVETNGPIPVPPSPNALPPAPGQIAAGDIHGRYGVQIAARPSQDEARAFIDEMRGKHAGLLAQQWAVIYRVKLPQGIFYRAVVGPFDSERRAGELCGNLKAKGEDCFLRGG
jgi:hypothetical protein